MLGVVGVAILVGPFLVVNIIGVKSVGLIAISLMTASGTLWQYGQMAHKIHELAGATRMLLVLICLAWGLELVVALILVPSLGIIGAATAAALGPAVYVMLVLWTRGQVRRRLVERLGLGS
jgi:hypothetical protein